MIDYFRVKTKEGKVFILMYVGDIDEWIIRFSFVDGRHRQTDC